jgi:hypothetical protein
MLQINNRIQLPELFDSLGLTGVGVEVGVDVGYFSAVLRKWKGGKIILVDPWVGNDSLYALVQRRLAWGNFQIIRDYSTQAAIGFPDESFDWVYIDANHDYKSVRDDITAWYPKLRPGGILSGHDYIDGRVRGKKFGVKRAVDELVSEKNLQLMIENGENRFRSWYLQIPIAG